MSKIDEFVKYLKSEVKNNSIYVLGGQGESVMTSLTPKFLEAHESDLRIAQIYQKLANGYADKKDFSNAKIFDCSGLGVYYFLKNGYIKSDMTADGIYKICTPIEYKDMRTGDFVFQYDGNTKKMHHIGYVIGIEDNHYQVIEAKGRAWGVVQSEFSQKNWTHYGRPKFWNYSINRELIYEEGKPLMKGEDVREVQTALTRKGYKPGTLDGEYGKNTANAVAEFQEKETTVFKKNYGKVNKNTAIALGFNWKE